MNIKHVLCAVVSIVSAIGAINWGLVAIHNKYNMVEKITNKNKDATKVLYSLIAICGIASLICTINWIMKPNFSKQE